MGAYPRGKGSNTVEGNGHFFRSCRQLYLSSFSSFSDMSRPTQRRSLQTPDSCRCPADRNWNVSQCMLVFTMELAEECLKCLFELTRGVSDLMV